MESIDIAFRRYLKETLGVDLRPKSWAKAETLPLFLRHLYTFFEMNLLGIRCLAMAAQGEEEQTPVTVGKHIAQVRAKWGDEVVYVRRKVTAYNRRRLIEHKLPFVVPGNQMYLPFLGIELREHFRQIGSARSRCSPATQVVVLHALLQNERRRFTPKQLADDLKYTAMTMTRALNELEKAGLGHIAREGRERVLEFQQEKRSLWESALKTMRTPVRKRMWVIHSFSKPPGVKAGLSALAHYSALAEPANPVFAVGATQWKRIEADRHLRVLDIAEPGACEIEIWRYSPVLFAENGVVDRFSLSLSIGTVDDERVESALASMMEQVSW